MLESKNVQSKKEILGQFFTSIELATLLLDSIDIDTEVIIEPSFGEGGFIIPLLENYSDKELIGIELDEYYYDKVNSFTSSDSITLYNMNFYDYYLDVFCNKGVTFIGNPPFRTPAYSLKTHNKYIKLLCKKYKVKGIREEVIFFIIKTCDLILSNNINGIIHYIVPEVILKNRTKFYKSFVDFLLKYFYLSVKTIDSDLFTQVSQRLVFISLKLKLKEKEDHIQHNILIDNEERSLEEYLNGGSEKLISFHDIFKKTYLGSVPCESILMSVEKEPKKLFIERLIRLFNSDDYSDDSLLDLLSYKNDYHLRVLKGTNLNNRSKKLSIIRKYIKEIKEKINLDVFSNMKNYKKISHRKGTRYYFRHTSLKKLSFVYELNPNPCRSFYFTGNPSNSSTDYFGFCDYDVNRNSSPGACRTIPCDDIENNVTDYFKEYWNKNTDCLPFDKIFDYIIHISKTKWYKDIKKKRRRLYFSIPFEFDRRFLDLALNDKK